MLHNVVTDLRYAVRSLRRSPGFAAAAIATIALGIGANTGIFSILNGVLFRDIPVPGGHELVAVYQAVEGAPGRAGGPAPGSFSTAEYETYRDSVATLSGLTAYSNPTPLVLGGEAQLPVVGVLVACNLFDVLEQAPAMGRDLTGADCARGTDPVVVLGHELWSTTFEADPAILGRTVEINRRLATVVGVAGEGTYGGRFKPDFFVPVSAEPLLMDDGLLDNDQGGWLSILGRRNDGVSLEQIAAELGVVSARIDLDQPGRTTTVIAERARQDVLPPFVRTQALGGAAVIMIAFGLLLFVACANIANLLLARGTRKSREFALRLSLGASRAHLVRQLLFESLILSLAGGVLGSVLALGLFRRLLELAIPTVVPVGLPPLAVDVSPDLSVFVVMFSLALGAGVLFGLTPALYASRTDLHSVVKEDSAGGGESRGNRRLQGVLLGMQAALCMVLIVGAGLLVRGLNAAQAIDPGFDYGNVTVLSYDYYEETGHEDDPAFWERLRAEIAAVPGIDGAAYAGREPLGDDSGFSAARLPGSGDGEFRPATFNPVSPEYFSVLGLGMTTGRTFTEGEVGDGQLVAVISESTARNFWGSADPIGQMLQRRVGFGQTAQDIEYRIVGVAEDAQLTSLGAVDAYYVFVPTPAAEKVLIRSRMDFPATAAAIREVVRRLDPALPAPLYPLEANLDRWRGISAILTTLAGSLGVVALALAGVGIYGVVSFFVSRRVREMGVRVALGARAANLYRLIFRRTMVPVVVGATIGIVGAFAFSGVLSSVLFGVSPLDPVGVGGAMLFVLGVTLAAGGWAARRATRVDPMAALRYE
jgi:predicted permease